MPELPDESTTAPFSNVPPKEQLAVRIYRLKLIAFRYWWIVALTVSIGMAIQGYRWSIQIPHYVSSSEMMVSGQPNISQNTLYSEEISNFYGTQVALMKSPETVDEAKARVRAMHPEVEEDGSASVGASQEPRTSIFSLQVVSTNPQYAQLLLNAVMDSFLSKKRGRKEQTTDEAVTAITEEISKLDGEIKADGQALLDFQKDNNVVYIEQQSTSAANYLVELNNEMARMTKERDFLALANSTPQDLGSTTTSDANSTIALQEANIERLKILRDDLGVYLKDGHPKMQALADSIAQEDKYLDDLRTDYNKARGEHLENLGLQIENLEKQISDWNQKSLDLNQRLTTFQQLKAKISREENMYDQLASSFQNLNLNKSLDLTDVSIMNPASPGYLIPGSLPIQLIYGAILGILVGVCITYFINRLDDDKVDSPFELAEAIQVPIIGQVPLTYEEKKDKRLPLLIDKDKRHSLVESFRDLRSFILFYATESRPRSILICSAEPSEGKSTVAANLAITFASTGARVLLVDGDLRRGVLHGLFNLQSSPGLSEHLEGLIPWQEVVQKTNYPTLDVLSRGTIPDYPGELLLNEKADLLYKECNALYEIVLYDSAPLLAADDASNMCPKVDVLLFVVRSRRSSIRAVRSALEIVSRRSTKLLGIILNAVQSGQPGYYARYKYKDYYSKGSKD